MNEKEFPYNLNEIKRLARTIANLDKEREQCLIWIPSRKCYMSLDTTEKSKKKAYYRDFYRLLGFCIYNKAESAIIMHNHPLYGIGDHCWASETDVESANHLKKNLKEFGVDLLDSLIVSDNDIWSIAEHNWEFVMPKVWSDEYLNRKKTDIYDADY